MAAKTTKENQHFLDMMDNSTMPEMGLIGAKLVDLEENAIDSNKKGATHRAAVMTELGTISGYIKDVESNKKAIKANEQAITDMKVANGRTIALIAAGASIIGSGFDNGVAWIKELLAP